MRRCKDPIDMSLMDVHIRVVLAFVEKIEFVKSTTRSVIQRDTIHLEYNNYAKSGLRGYRRSCIQVGGCTSTAVRDIGAKSERYCKYHDEEPMSPVTAGQTRIDTLLDRNQQVVAGRTKK